MNIREPLERLGKWRQYQDAVETQDWPKVKSLLLATKCSESEMKAILWSLKAPGYETEVETTRDKIIGRGGTVLIGAVCMGLVFAWQASGFSSDPAARERAMKDHRPWKQVVGKAFATGAVIGGVMATGYLYASSKQKK